MGREIDFDDFYGDAYAGVVRVLVPLTRRRAVAEELAQEALLAAYRSWDEVRQLDRPDLWVRRVAINRAVSVHRRVVAEVAALARVRGRPVVSSVVEPGDERIWRAVRALPTRQAIAVALWAVEDRSLADIGEVLGCSAETARTHLRRARERLAVDLQEYR